MWRSGNLARQEPDWPTRRTTVTIIADPEVGRALLKRPATLCLCIGLYFHLLVKEIIYGYGYDLCGLRGAPEHRGAVAADCGLLCSEVDPSHRWPGLLDADFRRLNYHGHPTVDLALGIAGRQPPYPGALVKYDLGTPVFPVVNAVIGLQLKPTDHTTINLEGGIRTLPFVGVSSSFFF